MSFLSLLTDAEASKESANNFLLHYYPKQLKWQVGVIEGVVRLYFYYVILLHVRCFMFCSLFLVTSLGRINNQAFVSLATNNGYALGALVLGHSLRSTSTNRQLALMITREVDPRVR